MASDFADAVGMNVGGLRPDPGNLEFPILSRLQRWSPFEPKPRARRLIRQAPAAAGLSIFRRYAALLGCAFHLSLFTFHQSPSPLPYPSNFPSPSAMRRDSVLIDILSRFLGFR
jgi:hypothetical protein